MNSMPGVRRSIRYVFAGPMLDAVEPALGQIGAGDISPAAGLDQLQAAMTKIVKDAGFLH